MADSILYGNEDYFVLLETHQPEVILSVEELRQKLTSTLAQLQAAELPLPPDLQGLPSIEAQVQSLIDTSCELDLGPGAFLQWYAVRLEKP